MLKKSKKELKQCSFDVFFSRMFDSFKSLSYLFFFCFKLD